MRGYSPPRTRLSGASGRYGRARGWHADLRGGRARRSRQVDPAAGAHRDVSPPRGGRASRRSGRRAGVRLADPAVRRPPRLYRRARARACAPEHDRRGGAGPRGAVRGRRRPGLEAAVGRAPGGHRRAGHPPRPARRHPGGPGRSRSRPGRGRADRRLQPGRGGGARGERGHRGGHPRADRRAGPAGRPPAGARPRRPVAAVGGPGVLHGGGRGAGDRGNVRRDRARGG